MTNDQAIAILHGDVLSTREELNDAVVIAINAIARTKHGRWVKNEEGDFHCSLCKAIVESDEKSRHYWGYCYHCGAKMDVKEMME